MWLKEIVKNSSIFLSENIDKDIIKITSDSRVVEKDSLFFAVSGYSQNGEKYINDALKNGASVIVTETGDHKDTQNTVFLASNNIRRDIAIIAKNFFQSKCDDLDLFAVTGTNGKSSTVIMLNHILDYCGEKNSYISTIQNKIVGKTTESSLTTPDAIYIHNTFYEISEVNSSTCILEASSHGISQSRLYGIDFKMKILTNISSDHLDYHGTKENYVKVKKDFLLDGKSQVVINLNDPVSQEIIQRKENVFTYALNNEHADLNAYDLVIKKEGLFCKVNYKSVVKNIVFKNVFADFMAENILAAMAASLYAGKKLDQVIDSLTNLPQITGRFSEIETDLGFRVIIDFAHTEDALKRLIQTSKKIADKNIRLVFGCGGDRDKSKRSAMGCVAQRYADYIYLTADNSRTEKTVSIIEDIKSGMNRFESVYDCEDRYKAIQKAIYDANPGDLVLIAGKGHEKYQDIGGKKIYFSDFDAVEKILNVIKKGLKAND